jgi:hypothetical protein
MDSMGEEVSSPEIEMEENDFASPYYTESSSKLDHESIHARKYSIAKPISEANTMTSMATLMHRYAPVTEQTWTLVVDQIQSLSSTECIPICLVVILSLEINGTDLDDITKKLDWILNEYITQYDNLEYWVHLAIELCTLRATSTTAKELMFV